MSKMNAIKAIKEFVLAINFEPSDSFTSKMNVIVQNNNSNYVYKDIFTSIYYVASYGQFNVEIVWEDDKEQVDYKSLQLHGTYNTNFQTDMTYSNQTLSFNDGENKITLYR